MRPSGSLTTRPRYPHDADLVLPHSGLPHILRSVGRLTGRQRRGRWHGDHDGDLDRLWWWSCHGWWSRRVITPGTSRNHIRPQRRHHAAHRAVVPPPRRRLRGGGRFHLVRPRGQFRAGPNQRCRDRLYASPLFLVRRRARDEVYRRHGVRPRL
jgi:hypothetical protein